MFDVNAEARPGKKVSLNVKEFGEIKPTAGSPNFGMPKTVDELECIKRLEHHEADENEFHDNPASSSPRSFVSAIRSQAGSSPEPGSPSDDESGVFATQAPALSHTHSAIASATLSVGSQMERGHAVLLDLLRAVPSVMQDIAAPQGHSATRNQSDQPPDAEVPARSWTPTPSSPSHPAEIGSARQSSQISDHTQPHIVDRGDGDFAPHLDGLRPTHSSGSSAEIGNDVAKVLDRLPNSERATASQLQHRATRRTQQARHDQGASVANDRHDEPDHPWQGLRRIPRKYVHIHKDQQKLLGKSEAWYSPELLTHLRDDLLPDQVLAELEAFHASKDSINQDASRATDTRSEDDLDAMELSSGVQFDGDAEASETNQPSHHLSGFSTAKPGEKVHLVRENGRSSSLHTTTLTGRLPGPDSVADTTVPSRASDAMETSIVEETAHSLHEDRDAGVEPLSQITATSTDSADISEAGPSARNPELVNRVLRKVDVRAGGFDISSSPKEMEIDVPLCLPSTAEARQTCLEVERTPYARRNSCDLPGEKLGYGRVRPLQVSDIGDQQEDRMSDPIIPGTFDGETHLTSISFRGAVIAANRSPGPASRLSSRDSSPSGIMPISPVREERMSPGYSASQINTDTGQTSAGTPMLGVNNTRTSVEVITSSVSVEVHTASVTIPATQDTQIPSSQLPSRSSTHEVVSASPTRSGKRGSDASNASFRPSSKRRRVLPTELFVNNTTDDEPTEDPSALARANRLKFIRQLSLSHDSVKDSLAEITGRDSIPESKPSGTDSASKENTAAPTDRDPVEVSEPARFEGKEPSPLHQINSSPPRTMSPRQAASQQVPESLEKTLPPQEPEKLQANLFQKFTTVYPDYRENMSTFIKACVYLKQLRDKMRAPPPMLWDDFIRVFSTEYPSYAEHSLLTSKQTLTAIQFYNHFIDEPLFAYRVVTAANLSEALLLDAEVTLASEQVLRSTGQHHHAHPSPSGMPFSAPEARDAATTVSATAPLQNGGQSPRVDTDGDASGMGRDTAELQTDRVLEFSVATKNDNSNPADPRSLKGRYFETPSQLPTRPVSAPLDQVTGEIQEPSSTGDITMDMALDDPVLLSSKSKESSKQRPKRVLPWMSSPSATQPPSNESDHLPVRSGHQHSTPVRRLWTGHDEQPVRSETSRVREASPILGSLPAGPIVIDLDEVDTSEPSTIGVGIKGTGSGKKPTGLPSAVVRGRKPSFKEFAMAVAPRRHRLSGAGIVLPSSRSGTPQSAMRNGMGDKTGDPEQ